MYLLNWNKENRKILNNCINFNKEWFILVSDSCYVDKDCDNVDTFKHPDVFAGSNFYHMINKYQAQMDKTD